MKMENELYNIKHLKYHVYATHCNARTTSCDLDSVKVTLIILFYRIDAGTLLMRTSETGRVRDVPQLLWDQCRPDLIKGGIRKRSQCQGFDNTVVNRSFTGQRGTFCNRWRHVFIPINCSLTENTISSIKP